jgi:hypothetical protein
VYNGNFHEDMLAYVSNTSCRENQNARFMRSEHFSGRTEQNYWAVNAFRNLVDIRGSHGSVFWYMTEHVASVFREEVVFIH